VPEGAVERVVAHGPTGYASSAGGPTGFVMPDLAGQPPRQPL
jgi:hypothetical protein